MSSVSSISVSRAAALSSAAAAVAIPAARTASRALSTVASQSQIAPRQARHVQPKSRQAAAVSALPRSIPKRQYATAAAPEKTYPKTFNKILIANRGEIACRVIRTARKMGIKTVAVYSEADASALHVQLADEAVLIGPAPTNQSYLVIENIVKACKQTGAEAVHPGYGFLSENSAFVKALDEAGVAFIGPNTSAMFAMGDKIQSKIIARKAGVSCIPGFDGVVSDAEHAVQISREIGYPVMVKASAGGGGKGMRIAWNDEEAREAFRLSSAEAKSSFGDDRLLVEKFIEDPRHIEIQLIGDQHGNVVYLPERECSIQRRNQKVIEEAPSVHIDPETRRKMGEQAVALAKNVGYYSAGTVEMLCDAHRNFYFLEMNTRLQVEHPITEQITQLDLVELMILVAAGHPLPIAQSDVKIHGWATESRVYAEDPVRFLPSIGRLNHYQEPKLPKEYEGTNAIVRCDSGIREGSEISMYYDPMICKLITHGKDRKESLELMEKALDSYVIKGVTHNIPLLREVVAEADYREGKISTKYLPTKYPKGFLGHQLTPASTVELLATAGYVYARRDERDKSWIQTNVSKFHAPSQKWDIYVVVSNKNMEKESHKVSVEKLGKEYKVVINDETEVVVDADWTLESSLVSVRLQGSDKSGARDSFVVQYSEALPVGFSVIHHGTSFNLNTYSPAQFAATQFMKEKPKLDTSRVVLAPMPGTVVSLSVKPGDTVNEGSEIAIVEAMKMQNVLRAPRGGKIAKVNVSKGASVAADEILVEFEVTPAAKS
ncbi:hypothetical protein M427DRAFT_35231 [Gonapodya prolifera JEL478]|uniref:Uncharacterized protein n=1 Tax=Gonapodya prolifera (strain JEL478) TaxID=1344416 RepID=A0A139A516_GONPJ|nr:hypothetical protein M427DRAFT_35231 [Gonapodya prolifera JEL478]|eukprot:KXS11912.1 hypothetical protein M427DRAFT_35231 [Gonapodya prolifera JEL478]